MSKKLIAWILFILLITSNSWGTIYRQNFIFDSTKLESLNKYNNMVFEYPKKFDISNFNNKKFFFYLDIKDMKFVNLHNYYTDLGNFYNRSNSYFNQFSRLSFDHNSFFKLDNNLKFEFNTMYNLKGNIYFDFKTSIYLDKNLSFKNLDRKVVSNLRVIVKF